MNSHSRITYHGRSQSTAGAIKHSERRCAGPNGRMLRKYRSGRTLLEALIASLIALFIGSALLMLMQSTMTARSAVQDGSAAMRDARRSMDTMQNNIRNAQMVSGTGVFSSATSNSITCYTNMAGTTTARYWLDTTTSPYSFKQTVNNTTTTLLTDVQSVTFSYYLDGGTNYTSSSAFTTTVNANAPTAAEIPNLGAVNVTVYVTSGGVSRSLTSRIRLRNSPAKPHI